MNARPLWHRTHVPQPTQRLDPFHPSNECHARPVSTLSKQVLRAHVPPHILDNVCFTHTHASAAAILSARPLPALISPTCLPTSTTLLLRHAQQPFRFTLWLPRSCTLSYPSSVLYRLWHARSVIMCLGVCKLGKHLGLKAERPHPRRYGWHARPRCAAALCSSCSYSL